VRAIHRSTTRRWTSHCQMKSRRQLRCRRDGQVDRERESPAWLVLSLPPKLECRERPTVCEDALAAARSRVGRGHGLARGGAL
jgi:hypothetical protein